MIRTGDEDRFTAVSWLQTCTFCARAIESTREIHAEATVVEGTEESVEILKVYEFDEFGGGYPIDIRITETDGFSFDADGVLIHTEQGGSVDSRIELLHDGATWRLANLVRLEDIK
ncbi:hypothetical protein Xcel_1538 [Xylanimonas cellulosilytica DSM 15894]|uniref:Uncharacterized protein n=2 Tax=Xylanimonas TaxID=186188 RepID=D1BS76_XYLCX|nr:hypothetical protein Xcel_1538 [Xylanimonas cellulosilytica DSM 15894]